MTLTAHDIAHLHQTWHGLHDPSEPCGCENACDCHDSEIVAASVGYVEVWHDGTVVAHGIVIADVADDSFE